MGNENKSIQLKRVVMVKAIVTEAFKENLVRELERAISNLDLEENSFLKQSESYLIDLKNKGVTQQTNTLNYQLQEEISRMEVERRGLINKIEQAKNLVMDSEFTQGPLEGPIEVKIGDNLYKKIGGAEIVIKDGIVVEIRGN